MLSESVFDKKSLGDIYEEIKKVYLSDNRPWIIGFSGGKDSTCMVQIVWHALSDLPKEKLQKKIYIISSDTLVETPKIAERIMTTLDNIEQTSKKTNLSISTNLLRPKISDTFWVRLLGLGYPAPTIMFRWCTDMLKINNADRFIQEKVSEYGEAIVLLGMRKNESSKRQQVMNLYKIPNSLLSRHSQYAQTYVYTPLEDFSAEDVWNYLLQNKNPWGEKNRDLLALYQDANASECPLVVDTSTASCGGGRFGCWTCTVVDKQKHLGNFIEHGDEWMETLVELRQELKDTQDSEAWDKVREKKRRHGRVELRSDGSGKYTPGPYTMDFRRQYLEKLLLGQIKIQKEGPNPNQTLILDEEVHEIQRIWRMEQGDWQNSAYQIYEKVTGKKLESAKEDMGGFGKMESELLQQVCTKHSVPSKLVSNLLNVEFLNQGATRHSKIYGKIKTELTKEWRTDMTQIMKELTLEQEEKENVKPNAFNKNNT
ncbi:MAG: DNA phosphorothioation system sulfurtransferase DndC [Nitrosarchaeum sp.]|nr:MAG: DNA phosphorothioation system sulfurtransferase DndC [Nitrosarchaeum sp.]